MINKACTKTARFLEYENHNNFQIYKSKLLEYPAMGCYRLKRRRRLIFKYSILN